MRLSLFFFLHLVAFVILLLVHPHAKAEDDGWYINDFGDYVVAAVPGEVIHGDKLRFFVKKNSNNQNDKSKVIDINPEDIDERK